jgi:iron complex outermembrane receptor protein
MTNKKHSVRPSFTKNRLALAVALTAVACGPAYAQSSLQLEEVIVTAQKRDQSVQDVPISIAVLGQMQLDDNGVSGLEDFALLVPSMNYVSTGPGSGNIYMRGISGGGESALGSSPNVAVYMDEQPVTAVGAFLNPHIYDVARIETLAGPQGTLFGANAQAGSIRIITNKPEPGVFSAGYDLEYNSIEDGEDGNLLEGFVNIPLGDSAAIRIVGWRKDEAGYIDNVAGTHTFDYGYIRDGLSTPEQKAEAADKTINNQAYLEDNFNEATTTGVRANVRFDLNENWTITAGVMSQELESEGVWDHDPDDVGDLEVVRFQPDSNDDEWTQISLVVEGKIGEMTLTYAGSDLDRESQQQADYSLYADASLSPGYTSTYYSCYVAYFGGCEDPTILYTNDNEYERENHELRLVSSQENRFRWLVGAFYEDASHAFDSEWHVLGLSQLTTDITGKGTPAAVEEPDIYWTTDQVRANEETAFFGEVSFDFTDKLTASASTRYFDYDSSLDGFSGTVWWPNRYGPRVDDNTHLETNHSDSVGKVSASYSFNEDIMVYGTWSEGYRPGGLNRVYGAAISPVYEPDFLESFEIGAKMMLLDNRLRLNIALYTQEWDDFQLSQINTDISVLTLTDNVGNAESDGLELDGSYLILENWSVDFGLAYIDSTLSENYWATPSDEGSTPPQAKKGTELPRVPDLKWNVSTRYTFDMLERGAFIQASYTYVGESYNLLYGVSSTRDRAKQDDYAILNMAFGIDSGSWSGELFVTNATDERSEIFINGATYDDRITTSRPRTFGIRFRQKFDNF